MLAQKLLDNEMKKDMNNKSASVVYHLPGTIFFKDFQNGKWVKTPVDDILSNSSRNIAKYGYAMASFIHRILQTLQMERQCQPI